MKRTMKTGFTLLVATAALIVGTPRLARAQQDNPPPANDNTKTNRGDANQGAVTADQQKMNAADRATTQNIRAALMKDKSLSTYAHNIKIITQNGKVTLKGPVRSEDEKADVEGKAATIAGADNVTSQITVVPPKQ
jgi:hyperosmotically inducible periplasmic protein